MEPTARTAGIQKRSVTGFQRLTSDYCSVTNRSMSCSCPAVMMPIFLHWAKISETCTNALRSIPAASISFRPCAPRSTSTTRSFTSSPEALSRSEASILLFPVVIRSSRSRTRSPSANSPSTRLPDP